jgi:hypothetical protein
MLNPTYLKVLRKLYTRLVETDINWVITGSLGFALQGAPVEPNDIDLQSDKAGAYQIERCFTEFVVKPVSFSVSEKIRSHFGSLKVHGIKVEIMGDIQKRLTDETWEEPVNLETYKRTVKVEEMQIPVLSLEYEYTAYLKLGRIEKAEVLRQWLERNLSVGRL